MKIFFCLCLIGFVIIVSNETNDTGTHMLEEEDSNNDHYKEEVIDQEDIAEETKYDNTTLKIFKEMKITELEELTKEQFKELLTKVVLEDNSDMEETKDTLIEIVEKIASKLPEKVPKKEIIKYSDHHFLLTALDEIVKERHGEEILDEFQRNEVGVKIKDDL